MKLKNALLFKAILIASTLPFLAACVERQTVYRDRPVYVQPPPQQAEVVVEDPAPPPPQLEVISVAPDPSYLWVGGSWEWRGRWVWRAGRWSHRPRPGAVWAQGHWDHHGHARIWVRATWR